MKNLLICILCVGALSAFAGDKGNGGFVLNDKGKLFTYDLYEAGLHELDENTAHEDRLRAKEALTNALPLIGDRTLNYFSYKLNILAKHSRAFSLRVLDLLSAYEWRLTPGSLIPVDDIGRTPIQINELSLIRAAFRDDRPDSKMVWIDSNLFDQLDARNQSALLLHELFYAIAVERKGDLTSEDSRKAVSMVYIPGLSSRSSNNVMGKLQSYLGLISQGIGSKGMECQEIKIKAEELSIEAPFALDDVILRGKWCEKLYGESYCISIFTSGFFGSYKSLSLKNFLSKNLGGTLRSNDNGERLIYLYSIWYDAKTEVWDRDFLRAVELTNHARDSRTGELHSHLAQDLSEELVEIFKEDPPGTCIPAIEKEQLLTVAMALVPEFYKLHPSFRRQDKRR